MTKEFEYPLFKSLKNHDYLLEDFNKLKHLSHNELEEKLFNAELVANKDIDSIAYVGYKFLAEGGLDKIFRTFVELEDTSLFVYEVPIINDGNWEVWKPELGKDHGTPSTEGKIPLLGNQGSGTRVNGYLIATMYSNEKVKFVEKYRSISENSRILIGKTTSRLPEYIILARSRPITKIVTERSKKILNKQLRDDKTPKAEF